MEALDRIADYLESHAPERLETVEQSATIHDGNGKRIGIAGHVYQAALIREYRKAFSPEGVHTKLTALQAEHDNLVEQWGDLPTPRAKETAKAKLVALDAQIKALEQQGENLAEEAERCLNEWHDLLEAVGKARKAMKDARQLRRAEALRSVIHRIDCQFTATGEKARGGKRHSRLAKVVIHPISGESVEFSTFLNGTVQCSSAHSRM